MDKKTKWTPDGAADTPYMRARQEWDRRMGSAVVQAHSWRLAAFASLGLVAMSVVGIIVLGAKPKAIPHIIEVDSLGAATYRGPAGKPLSDYSPSEAVLKYHLRRFIESTRTISADPVVLKKNWVDAYQLVTPRAANMLTAYVSRPENEPFRRAQDERVSVEVLAMVRVSAETWQIDWRETSFDRNGSPVGNPALWRGMFRTLTQLPKTEEALAKNPIGLYVDEFHWDKIQG